MNRSCRACGTECAGRAPSNIDHDRRWLDAAKLLEIEAAATDCHFTRQLAPADQYW